jgi:manganese transport protein
MGYNRGMEPGSERQAKLNFLRYIGPGFLVTVGFIDPGNWAANVATGSIFGYPLLWVVTLSTLMLILLQHNAAHLGIATGLCLAEAANLHLKPRFSRGLLASAVLASIATAMAEILGLAIGLNMLFRLSLPAGALLGTALAVAMLFSNSYRRLEKWIMAFVSLIAFSFVFELLLVKVGWPAALKGLFLPAVPRHSLPLLMSVLGAVVMPHNIFLHSEVIQSRHWNLQDDRVIRRQLRFEFMDTLAAMLSGWVINAAMIIVAAAVFRSRGLVITELPQAEATLRPLLGPAAAVVFALALVFAGFSSSVTAAMAGGSIVAGMAGKPFRLTGKSTRAGVALTMGGALLAVFLLRDPFQGLIWSQILLSLQLPLTIFPLIRLTSAKKVMGPYVNSPLNRALLLTLGFIVSVLNLLLLIGVLFPGGG